MEIAHYHGDYKIPLSHRNNALRPQTTDFNNYHRRIILYYTSMITTNFFLEQIFIGANVIF